MKRYALKGINDEDTECGICGKAHLKRVMWLVELDEGGSELGDPFPAGTTCGARLMGQKVGDVKRAVDNFAIRLDIARSAYADQHQKAITARRCLTELNRIRDTSSPRMTYQERCEHTLYKRYHELMAEARAEAEAVITHVEI